MNHAIYVLIDPRCGRVRYVGQTNNPKTRLAQHMSEAVGAGWPFPRRRWIAELRALDLRPRMEIIEQCAPQAAHERERHWIGVYARWGCDLVNGQLRPEHAGPTHRAWMVERRERRYRPIQARPELTAFLLDLAARRRPR